MRTMLICLLFLLAFPLCRAQAQGTVPTFRAAVGQNSYTLVGDDPAKGGITTIPTVLVPIRLSFDSKKTAGKPLVMDAAADVPRILHSPIFSKFQFASGERTQYADAMMRTTFPHAARGWHTLLSKPEIRQVTITVPVGDGYILTSKKSGGAVAVVDIEFLQEELFKRIPKMDGRLVIAVTHNTTYYALGDATVCCSWGTHGVDSATGNSFVLGSYLRGAPAIVTDRDVQPLSEQLAEFFNDPLRDPLVNRPALIDRSGASKGNAFPRWMHPALGEGEEGYCGGAGVGSPFFLLQPTDMNHKNNFPASKGFAAHVGGETYHLQNVALLPWYTGGSAGSVFSFPDANALTAAATPCPTRFGGSNSQPKAAVEAAPRTGAPNGHQLIGYWTGHGTAGAPFELREVSPQWDVIIVAFATPDKASPGTLHFRPPAGIDPAQFKADVAYMKSQGRKVMISLGGGGQFFTMPDAASTGNFLSSVTSIVSEYGFDGIDLDFESPSLVIDSGDTDFEHPTTPSIVNMISALRKLREHFGPGFMISLVPEGTQIPAGYPSYGGQFGSYLPIAYAVRDILSFVDVQDYNTPPLQGLDGEIYQTGSVDYHAAMTELLLHGFDVGEDPAHYFPGMPARQVAVGFLTGYSTPKEVSQAMEYIITGKAPADATYKLRKTGGYPEMIGAMFWTIDADRRGGYNYSNLIGPQLYGYPAVK